MARTVPGYPRRTRRDWGRVFARFLCAIFSVIGAVPLGVGLLVRTSAVRTWAARETSALLERELGLTARYRVDVSVWPLSLGLSDVVVDGSDALGAALEVARLSVRPRLFALLGGHIDAGHIEVDGPRVRLVMRDGVVQNLRYHLPQASDSPASRRAPFTSLAITDAALDVDIDGWRVRGGDVDVDVTTEEGPKFEVILKTGEQSIVRTHDVLSVDPVAPGSVDVDEDVLCHLDARVRLGGGGVLVHRLALSALADSDGRSGTAPSCAAPATDPRRIELGLRQAQATFASGVRPEVDGSVHARGPLGLVNRFIPFPPVRGFISLDVEGGYGKASTMPVLRGKIEGKEIGIERYHLMSELSADFSIDDDVIRSDHVAIGFGDGTLIAKNIVVEPLKKGSPLRVGVADGTNIRFPSMMRDLGVTPHAHVNWVYKTTHVTGFEGTLSPLRMDAEFSGTTSDFEVFDRAVSDPQRHHMIGVKEAHIAGHAAIRPEAVTFRNSRIDFGESHIDANVSLGFDNDLVLSIAPTTKIDLANISPLANLTLTGKAALSGEMKGKFNDPQLVGDLSVAGLALQDFPLGDITSSKVRFRPLTVDFSELHAKKGKSTFDIPSGRLDFNGPATLVATASVDAADLYVRDFFHMFHFDADPRFDNVDGHGRTTATLRYDLGGKGDPCGGGAVAIRGAVHMPSMDLFEEHYDSLDSEFSYHWLDRDAADLGIDVDIRSLTLKKGRGTLFGSGTIRRGGAIRAELVADDIPLSKLQALGSMSKVLDGTASAVGTVSGTLDEMEADVDVRMSPIRIGTSVLPGSRFHVGLAPSKRNAKIIGHTRCGQPMTPGFDRAEYDRDLAQGTFHVSGELFDHQIAFDDFKITRQQHKTTSGLVTFDKLDLSALGSLRGKSTPDAGPREAVAGSLSAALEIASFPLDTPERMRATLALKALDLHTSSGKVQLKSKPPPLTIGDDRLTLPSIDFEVGAGNGFHALVTTSGDMRRLSTSPEVNLSARVAPMNLASLATLLPRVERANGTLDATVNVTGKMSAPAYTGEIHLRDGELSFRGFPMPLSQMNVDLAIGDGEVRVLHGLANVGGGTVNIGGHAPIRGFKLGEVSGFVTAKGVSVPIQDGISMTCDADLRAEWGESEEEESTLPRLSGEVMLTSFSYTRPIAIGAADIGSIAQRGRRTAFQSYDPADDMMTFDVQLKSRDPLRLSNNLIEAQLMVDSDALVFSGTNQRFGMRGRLRLLTGGRIRLRANEFEIRQGYVQFDDTTRIAPHVDVTAVTEYRRYSASGPTSGTTSAGATHTGGVWRITLHAFGDADNLTLDMTSEPALAKEDIVLLLTVGMTRAEVDQLAASVGGNAALEALSSLTGADTAVKKAVPVIDEFRFGSAYSSRTGRSEATVTVGKRVTDQVRANVTTGLLENREIRSNLEWKLTPRVSVQGSYDNVNDVSSSSLGNIGADVRWRLEFE